LAHLVHPLYHPKDHAEAVIFERGEGVYLYDVEGRRYFDGLSCLWNVAIGHGRRELAEAAAQQMATLAYASNYTGFSNRPAIDLASRISRLAYPSLNHVFFTAGGAESNESAFKAARFYWQVQGRTSKVKIIAREYAYHGVTMACMAATGLPMYWQRFGPLPPGFVHVPAPYRYHCQFCQGEPRCNLGCADALERKIQEEGPETVAAFIAEPVQGSGGVIPPPPEYFPRIRAICDKYEVLFIADEVITGFGRTGEWFALTHWNVEPDIVSFAKAVTSAYLPLGGIILSDKVFEVLTSGPPDVKWMHAYTYSGHATACAVGVRNLQIMEEERLPERARTVGAYLQTQLKKLEELPIVGETRGLGMMAGVELVADKRTRQLFPKSLGVGERVLRAARERGLITRRRDDVIVLAPPLITTEAQVDELVGILGDAIQAVAREL
jgi:adenosylmethionine-8-amino-7-oxononanoate aminotransferase